MNRREFLVTSAASAAFGVTNAATPDEEKAQMRGDRRRRTAYFNDARHYWLYAFQPPMGLEEAWRPIDELAGTSINTFIYGVETEGLWSNTKVGVRAGSQNRPFRSAHGWRAWHNMQSLIDRGLDPLQVLIDRAHERGLEFITSMRLGGGPRDPRYYIGVEGPAAGGGGPLARNHDFAHRQVRDARFAWLEELADYPVEGIELDFAFTPYYFKPAAIASQTSVMTDWVRRVAEMVRRKSHGKSRVVGARVFPTLEMNRALGLDVDAWLRDGLVDYVAPLYYGYFFLDPDLPFESLAAAAHAGSAEVYPVLQPYVVDTNTHATPAMVRAAVANYWHKGADGMIVGPWFYWPFRDAEKAILTEIGDPRELAGKDKQYVVGRRLEGPARLGYDHSLPLRLEKPEPKTRHAIRFHVADDLSSEHVGRVRLCLRVDNLVTSDGLTLELNGASLADEDLRVTTHRYEFLWFEYNLVRVRPRQGENVLEVTFVSRPSDFAGAISVDQVEILVEYSHPRSAYVRPEIL